MPMQTRFIINTIQTMLILMECYIHGNQQKLPAQVAGISSVTQSGQNLHIYLAIILCLLTSSLLTAQTKKYATITGRRQWAEKSIFLTDEVLFEDTKNIVIGEVDGESTRMKNNYEINVPPGKHKIVVEAYMGQPAWNIKFRDTIKIDAVANNKYYLDCSTTSAFVSDSPAVADFSDQYNSGYLKMYDGHRRPEEEVARLYLKEPAIGAEGITALNNMFYGLINGRKININLKGYYSETKMKGVEILPGTWSFIHIFINRDDKEQCFAPVILNAKAGNLYDFEIDEVILKTRWFYNKSKHVWFLIPQSYLSGWGFYVKNITGYEESLADLDKAIELNPDDVENYYKRGLLNSEFHYYKEARKDFRQVNKMQEDYADIYYRLACAEFALAKFKKAGKDFEKALEINPAYAPACNGYGILKCTMARINLNERKYILKPEMLDDAITDFNRAVVLDSGYSEAFYNAGYASFLLGNPDVAIINYNKCIELNPDNHDAYFSRGLAREKFGLLDEALADFNRCIELNPEYYLTYYWRGNIYHKLSKYREAMKEYSYALRIYPYYAPAFNKLGLINYETGKYTEALKDFDNAINTDPDFAEAYNNRGLAHQSLGNYQNAVKDFNNAIRSDRNYAEAYKNRANTKKAMGKLTEAGNDYKKAENIIIKQKKKEMKRGH